MQSEGTSKAKAKKFTNSISNMNFYAAKILDAEAQIVGFGKES